MSAWDVAPAGATARLGLHIELEPGWHVYWKNSGDAGYPPALDVETPDDLADSALLWPSPDRFDLPGGLVAFGYEHEVVYPIDADLGTAEGVREISADLDYLVCEVNCLPYRDRLDVSLPVGGEGSLDPEVEPLLSSWESRLPRPVDRVEGLVAEAVIQRHPDGTAALQITLTGAPTAATSPDLFLAPQSTFTVGAVTSRSEPDGMQLSLPLTLLDGSKSWPPSADLEWTATGLGAGDLAVEAAGLVPIVAVGSAGQAVSSPAPTLITAMVVVTVLLFAALWRWRVAAPVRERLSKQDQ